MEPLDITRPTPLLGDLSPETFMRRHWQKKPLLVRGAVPGVLPPVTRKQLFDLAAQEDVESRLIVRSGDDWSLNKGPITKRPPLAQHDWTLLVQGVDQHVQAAHDLLARFRFVPDARLDDLMISYASDGGGVGPHFDSYDVFLLQVQGRRRWRIGRLADDTLREGLPLKVLANFEAEEEWLLEPGDMLYLPPRWAHDGTAEGECMTCSIGFRAAPRHEAAREVLLRLMDEDEDAPSILYRDPKQAATTTPGRLPADLQAFARDAVTRLLSEKFVLDAALGEWLTEPKPQVWFDEGEPLAADAGIALDRRTRMLYDDHHVFINGESYRAAGRDAALMRRLADQRLLTSADLHRASEGAKALIADWAEAGWLHADPNGNANDNANDGDRP